jgi:hypothetical protein
MILMYYGWGQNNGEPFCNARIRCFTGTKIVLVKILLDLSLWLGGVERLYNAGIEKLG